MTFDKLWEFIVKRRPQVVQERSELEHIFGLIIGCRSYLEIGTAEGDSMYVLSHALAPNSTITSVDLGERHTRPYANDVVNIIKQNHNVALYTGDSTNPDTYPNKKPHEVVFIDGGHDYNTALSDARMYGKLATKYLIFHDIKLDGVRSAVNKFLSESPAICKRYDEFVNSETMGYGIVEVAGE